MEAARTKCAAGTLRRASRSVARLYDNRLAQAGPANTQFSILRALERHEQPVPVLALGGTLDTQVPAKENLSGIDAALKAAGNRDYQIVELPGLNHLFQTATTGAPSEYATIQETIAPQVLDLITSWINQHFVRGERR